MRRNAVPVVVFVGMSMASALWGVWIWAGNPARSNAKKTQVIVRPGQGGATVGRVLFKRGIIRSEWYWRWLLSKNPAPKPGLYRVSAAERPETILKHMVDGKTATVRVTIPEGFTAAQVAQRLVSKGAIDDADAFVKLVANDGFALFPDKEYGDNLEGFLFPDTYDIPIGASPEQAVQQMVANFDRQWSKALEEAGSSPKRSMRELVVVASLIEREARTEPDRPMVAGVIFNRLDAGQRLEIDATVQYARGEHKKRLFFKDLEIDSPYNTYRNKGLPPGAICNPGYRALVAALRPAQHDFFYYVLGKDRRGHVFSKTFAEHKQRIAEIRNR